MEYGLRLVEWTLVNKYAHVNLVSKQVNCKAESWNTITKVYIAYLPGTDYWITTIDLKYENWPKVYTMHMQFNSTLNRDRI